MGQIKMIVQNSQVTAENVARIQPYVGDKYVVCQRMEQLMGELAEGRNGQSMVVYIDGGVGAAKASGTLTLASVVAGATAQIGFQTFTAVASGATGNQFNVGLSDTATAMNLAAVVNANSSLTNVVSASSSGAVVTVMSQSYGNTGNQIGLVGSTGNGTITASAAHLSGGAEPTNTAYSFGGSL